MADVKRSAVPLAATLAALALVALLIYGVASKGGSTTLDDAVRAGKRPVAPDRSLPVLGRPGRLSLASYRGKVVVLNFWASWCTPCRAEAPLLERIQRRLTPTGGTVLGATYDDAAPDSLGFVREFRLTYPSVRDVGTKLARAFAISRGQVSEKFLQRAVGTALAS
jgi:cytochrome c biogenesis protein CcmG, thiol:disulfide interchange protein DsbE